MKTTSYSTVTFFILSGLSYSATLSSGPDGWSRGITPSTAYFGWDEFEASGIPGNPSFGGQVLNDSSPDVGAFSGSTSLTQGNLSGYGVRSSSGNIYSGFTGEELDLNLAFSSLSADDSGFTTILLTILGNPALTNILQEFTLNYEGLTIPPAVSLTGESLELPGQKIWAAEWQVPGSSPSGYQIDILSDLSSGNGTDVALDSITIDLAWTAGSSALSNTSHSRSLGTIAIPEPSSALLLILAAPFTLIRRRA